MNFQEIYQPIQEELRDVEDTILESLHQAKNASILKVNRFLLRSSGKRLRPALVILSAKASVNHKPQLPRGQLINIASAIELIHMASLIHDDVIDHSPRRHHQATVNSRWGEAASIALGDYLHALAFKLIAGCSSADILACISAATQAMCEGELIQVLERDNLSLLKERYLLIIKKKTASLFAASCEAGALASNSAKSLQHSLKGYGLNLGIAFQIVDDYMDLVAPEEALGKQPGQDIAVGEVTLPVLSLLKTMGKDERRRMETLLKSKTHGCLSELKEGLANSKAQSYTKGISLTYVNAAKERLQGLPCSAYRNSLFKLGDLVLSRGFAAKK